MEGVTGNQQNGIATNSNRNIYTGSQAVGFRRDHMEVGSECPALPLPFGLKFARLACMKR